MSRYAIEAGRSQVWVTARSSLHPINATTTDVGGWFSAEVRDGHVDPAQPATAELAVDVDRLVTGNALYDRELRHRADTDRYPTIRGELRALTADGEDGRYHVAGDVTFHGVTNAMADAMEIRALDADTIELTGESAFDVREFGVNPPRLLGLRVHPDVVVRVRLVASRPSSIDE